MNMHNQRGMTMVSWLVVFAFLGFTAVAALNVIPAYLNFMSARAILNDLPMDATVRGKTPTDIKSLIMKRFKFSNIEHINVAKDVTLKSMGAGSSGFTVSLNYEHRGHIVGNLDYISTFAHSVEVYP